MIDCHRGNERISCVVSGERVQLLSYLNDRFDEKVFELIEKEKPSLFEYLDSLPCGKMKE